MKSDFRMGMEMEKEDICELAINNIRFVMKWAIKDINTAQASGYNTVKMREYKYSNIAGRLASYNAIGLITNRQYVFYTNITAKIAYGTAGIRDSYYDIP